MRSAKRTRHASRRLRLEHLENRYLLSAAPHPFDLSTLDGENGFRLDGYAYSGWAGSSVSDAGDVNGDNIPDLIIGAQLGAAHFGEGVPYDAGSAFVVFGRAEGFPATSNLNTLDGTNGFELRNFAAENSNVGSVSGAGDVNADGYDDVLISNQYANDDAGSTFVVFGKASGFPAMVDLALLDGTDGFRIDGEAAHDESGKSVSSAGDFNGDGYGDMIIGIHRWHGESDTTASAYIVFGKSGGFAPVLSLSTLDGTNGFSIEDTSRYDRTVSGGGDINGDGLSDVIIRTGTDDTPGAGVSVLFGSTNAFPASMDVSQLDGSNGFSFQGGMLTGKSVSQGDFNGDGFDDLLVGNPAYPDYKDTGEAFVIFGKPNGFAAELTRDELDGTNGFRIVGETKPADGANQLGKVVSGLGDFNGDGFDDFMLGTNDPNYPLAGGSYVVFGCPSFEPELNITSLDGTNGFRIDGGLGSYSYYRLSGAGDLNRDGFDDLMVSRPTALSSTSNAGNAGTVYVVYGSDVGSYQPGVTTPMVEVIVAGGNLMLIGNELSNEIVITQGVTADEFVLSSTVTDFGDGPGVPVTVAGITGDVTVEFGDEADVLQVGATDHLLTLPGNLFVDAGRGDNVVKIGSDVTSGGTSSVEILGDGEIDAGDGADSVRLGGTMLGDYDSLTGTVNLKIGGDVELRLGEGNNAATVGGDVGYYSNLNIEIGGDVDVTHGDGNNSTIVGGDSYYGRVSILIDGDVKVKNGAGVNQTNIGTSNSFGYSDLQLVEIGGNINIENGDGGNTTRVGMDTETGSQTLRVLGDVEISNGHGDDMTSLGDSIEIGGIDGRFGSSSVVFGGSVNLLGGAGNDSIIVRARRDASLTVAGELRINGGDGNDKIRVDNVSVTGKTVLLGGEGADKIRIKDSIFAELVKVKLGDDDNDLFFDLGGNAFNGGFLLLDS